MFERSMRQARLAGERRARARGLALAEAMRAEVPPDVEVEAVGEGVTLTGRGLRGRIALDERLRWLVARTS